jgi:hypothetical protein
MVMEGNRGKERCWWVRGSDAWGEKGMYVCMYVCVRMMVWFGWVGVKVFI